MLVDLIEGIISSLVASAIVGFLGNKVVSKQNSIILKIYILFLSIAVFISCSIVSVALNKDLGERIVTISEVNLLRFYQNCVNALVFCCGIIALLTIGVIIIEAYDRGARRDHKEDLARYKQLR